MNLRKCAAFAIAAALSATPAFADGYAVYEVSARGVGMGGAMMFSDEASLVAYNPAAITQFGYNGTFSGAVTYIAPRGSAHFYDAGGNYIVGEHNKNDPAYVPSMFYAKRVAENGWIGIGLFPRFGLKSSYEYGWYGRFSNRSADFTTFSITPTYAFKLAPSLSMSLGFELMYANLDFDKSLNSFSSLGISEVPMKVQGDGWACGWNLGLSWNATPKFSVAALYRSEVKQNIKGDVDLSLGALGDMSTYGYGNVRLPESYAFGLGWKFDDKTRMEVDAIRTNWSSYDSLDIRVGVPSAYQPILSLFGLGSELSDPMITNWSNGWRFQWGLEHKINKRWTVRCGFVWDECSSEQVDYSDFLVPTGTRRTYTVGASYRVKNVEYSLGYGYMTVGGKRINSGVNDGDYARTSGSDSHIISIGARVDF